MFQSCRNTVLKLVKSAYAGQFADELTDDEKAKLPVYKGELLMSTHAVGGYHQSVPPRDGTGKIASCRLC